jgi:anthranilate phosphoribosyltransferase
MDLTGTVTASVDEVVDLADPYDGYTRYLPISPFLPAVLAACGVRAVSHGVETVAPKQGATHRKILRAAGMDVDLDT